MRVAVAFDGRHMVGAQDAFEADVAVGFHAGQHVGLALVVPGFFELFGRAAHVAEVDEEDLALAAEVADGSPSAFELVAGEQERQRLAGCIDLLEERQRSAIRSAFFDGYTYAELAARGGTPLGTMKSWVRRGLAQLKSCLER